MRTIAGLTVSPSRGFVAPSARRRASCLFIAALALALAAGCGEDPKTATATTPEAHPGHDTERRVAEIEKNLANLDAQAQTLRAETQTRLNEIDATRQALASQVALLRTELNLPGKAIGAAKPTAAKPQDEAAKSAPEVSRGPGWFLRLILLVIIVGAIIFIGRIVFNRWGPDAEDEGFIMPSGGPRVGSGGGIGHAGEAAPPRAPDFDEP